MLKLYKKKYTSFILSFLLLTLILSSGVSAQQLKVHFLDVGQGDSTLIELPNNQTMLIDAGNNDDETTVVNYIRNQEINKIDYLIGTHPHADHIGGLDNVLYSLDVNEFYMPKVTHTSQTFKDVIQAAKNQNMKINAAKIKTTIINDKDLSVTVLSPVYNHYEKLNNWSAVIKVIYKDTSFLFAGDAESLAERQMLTYWKFNNLDADTLKVGHHGSDSSTTTSFLQAVSPDYAVISVGKDNRYGHPSSIVIDRLQQYGVKVFRTDKQGTIRAVSDGNNISFSQKSINKGKTTNKVSTNQESKITITNLDLEAEVVTIKNNSNEPVNISDWKLVSTKGNQTFLFPSETVIKGKETIKVTAGPDATSGKNKFIWDDWYIWNNNGDTAVLYNSNGDKVSTMEGR